MLTLTRRVGQSVVIDDNLTLSLAAIESGRRVLVDMDYLGVIESFYLSPGENWEVKAGVWVENVRSRGLGHQARIGVDADFGVSIVRGEIAHKPPGQAA